MHVRVRHPAAEPRRNGPRQEPLRPTELPLQSERRATTNSGEKMVSRLLSFDCDFRFLWITEKIIYKPALAKLEVPQHDLMSIVANIVY